MDKRQLRREVSARIAAMSAEEKAAESAAVAGKVLRLGIKGKKVFVYNALPDEADTSLLIKELAETNRVYLPVVDGDEMLLAEYDGSAKKGAFGIYEPDGKRYAAAEIMPDVCITPLRAFDGRLNRLGRGKGYYDRFFAACDCRKIALAFDCQKVESIPADEYDVRQDMVITASEIYGK